MEEYVYYIHFGDRAYFMSRAHALFAESLVSSPGAPSQVRLEVR